FVFSSHLHRPPGSPLFPYTTLFRSCAAPRTTELNSADGARTFSVTHFPARSHGALTGVVAIAREITVQRREESARLQESALLLQDRKSTRLNSSHDQISYAVFCLKK